MLLLERDAELALIAAAVDAARSGRGSLVLVSGPAGIGKSAVLAAAGHHAAGLDRLVCRGGELERDLPLGLARQLLEPAIAELEPAAAERLLDGAGAAADAILGRSVGGDGGPAVILHGLHRLVTNLAGERPLLVEADDVQWADAVSLRFLAFLAHRIERLPVVLLLARRSGEAVTDEGALRAIASQPHVRECVLAPLSLTAAAGLVRQLADPAADESFCEACHRASAGNPFVLRELVHAVRERGVAADADGAAKVLEAGPPAVARWVLARLARLPRTAGELARAVAVLGQDADLGRAARLAGLSLSDAEAALDALVDAALLGLGRPLDFIHPVVRTAVHDEMPPGQRSRAHRQAARLLRDQDATRGAVATHLLATEPAGEAWVAEALLEAAHTALTQGSPEVAAIQARRALAEPAAGDLRVRLLRALGNAERRLGVASADERFLAALEGTADPRERAETLLDMLITGAPETDVIPHARQALDDVAPVDAGLALVLRARLLLALENSGAPMEPELRAAERALERADDESLGTRLIAGMLARDAAMRGRLRRTVLSLSARAVADDQSYDADLQAGYPHIYALTALALADELALAERRLIAAAEWAERHGSLVGAGIALLMLAGVRTRTGALMASERDARRALELAESTSEDWLVAMAVATLVEALSEQGQLAVAQAVLERHGLLTAAPETPVLAVAASARSLLHLATDRPGGAYADASAVGRFAEAVGVRNPVMLPWRSRAALALIALGRRAEASVIAHEDLAIAEAADIPSAIGSARRVVALATEGEVAVPLLRDAVAVLEQAPTPLELARALTDLGAALRRAGQRQVAREPLARALELAHRHGAALLADTARTELRATGARPRRAMRFGVDALTASERRVAELAVAGLSNVQIATRLFITVKTVEHHLAAVYRKLDIGSRHQLPPTLDTTTQLKTTTADLASDHASSN